MKIYIPSRGRARLCRTWQGLPPAWQRATTHVVPVKELAEYKTAGLPAIPCQAVGIGPTRQWIIDNSAGLVLMLDDDLKFFERRDDDPQKFEQASASSISVLLAKIQKQKNVHGGVSPREGANRDTMDYRFNGRNLRALFYNADYLQRKRVRFDRLPVMEDFDVALQLLRLGQRSLTFNKWVHNQPASNTAGGCSTYRTPAVQAKGALGLAKLHPAFVKVVEKPALISGGWGGGPRLDVVISWKKAFEEGLRNAGK